MTRSPRHQPPQTRKIHRRDRNPRLQHLHVDDLRVHSFKVVRGPEDGALVYDVEVEARDGGCETAVLNVGLEVAG